MSSVCVELNRPLREPQPEEATSLAAKADLLETGVAVDEQAKVMIENEASNLYEGKLVGRGFAGCGDCPPGSCAGG